MPTGYTSSIYHNEKVTFEDFVLQCARGMGACIHQRDDNSSDKPTLRTLDVTYHLDAIKEAKKVKKPTKAQFEKLRKQRIDEYRKDLADKNALKQRYVDMLEQVKNWNPPSKEHTRFKEFMIEQLNTSINFDCGGTYTEESIQTWENMKYTEYAKETVNSAKRSINYHTEEIEKEKRSVESANKWITDLYNSLK